MLKYSDYEREHIITMKHVTIKCFHVATQLIANIHLKHESSILFVVNIAKCYSFETELETIPYSIEKSVLQKSSRLSNWPLNPSKSIAISPPGNDKLPFPT